MAPLFVGPFSIGDRAQTSADRRVSQRGELSRSREGCNVGPCLTSSYISPHNRAPRQIPLFVHILCIVTRVSRGTQGARTTSGEYVLSFFSFLSVLLPLFLSFSLLRPPHLSLSVDLAYPPPPLLLLPLLLLAFYFLLFSYPPSTEVVGGTRSCTCRIKTVLNRATRTDLW